MANVSVYNMEGKEVGTIELNDAVFGVEVNEHLVHMAVVAQLANKRQGNTEAKTRSEVSGGGRNRGDRKEQVTLDRVPFYGCFAWTKERVKPIKEQQGSLKDDLRDLLHNKPWWILLGAGVSALVFNSIRDGATVYYFKYFIIEEAYANVSLFGVSFVLSGLYLAVGQAANIVGVILAAPLSNQIGKKRTYMGSMLIASVLSILFFWLDKTDLA